ncbi:MAG TPA: glucose-6-phosphate isomerase, partial [Oligoflexia bacterium]|nr:glucose-6-phosphate isomerase [Oligoflexia bacterium]
PTFEIPPNLGGRYSVLSAVGLFPAMVAGLDYHPFLTGAQEVVSHFEDQVNAKVVPDALELAARLVQFYKKDGRNITVLMPYSQKLKTFSAWFVQLWAEGLGKNGLGITPVAATGPTDQHSLLQILRDGPNDKTVGFIEVLGFQNLTELKWTGVTGGTFDLVSGITLNQLMDAELNATRQVLSNQSRPHFSLCIPKLNPTTLGQLFQFLALTTALAGYLLEIDPFDQPGVEEGKVLAIDRINACKKNAIV